MLILGVETSCDETALALLERGERGCKILGEKISSQSRIHEQYGGVVPELAAREHMANLPLLLAELLNETGQKLEDVNVIGVTQGPGLHGCLLMGLGFAKGLALAQSIPLYGVNHIEGHILAPLLDCPGLSFPYLALVVSGGHSEIHAVRGVGDYELIARTIDDAAGEAFDKSANLLGFNYPGGALLAALADTVTSSEFVLPKVMREAEGLSFAGLKTAVSLLVKQQKHAAKDEHVRARLCFSIQESIVDALCFKLRQAMQKTKLQNLVVTGGVSANRRLREAVEKLSPGKTYFPELKHCTDNAAMIAYAAALKFKPEAAADYSLSARSRWAVEEA